MNLCVRDEQELMYMNLCVRDKKDLTYMNLCVRDEQELTYMNICFVMNMVLCMIVCVCDECDKPRTHMNESMSHIHTQMSHKLICDMTLGTFELNYLRL